MEKNYYCHKSVGKLNFDPGIGTKKHEPWWLILKCDQGIVDYYEWLLRKNWITVNKNTFWGSHISVIKGEEPKNKNEWNKDFGEIEFYYSNIIRMDNNRHAWIDCYSEQLADIRAILGVGKEIKMSYHLTIGNIHGN